MGFLKRAGAKKSGGKKLFGFTLTELLVVVIVLGVLAAVAVPKFTRVLETRKTTEAEDLLSAVRAEQEHRCLSGRSYTQSWTPLSVSASAKDSANYSFSLEQTGADAASKSKNYALRVLSYQDGRICCEGEYCAKLNKDYPLCADLTVPADDKCAGAGADFCTQNPDDCACNPRQAKCCVSGTEWNGSDCVITQVCSNAAYAAAHPCECAADTCACETYAAAYPCECDEAAKQSCQCKPNQEICCKDGEIWDGQKCISNTNTCQNAAYAAAHPCECVPNTCQCSTYAAAYPCECAPNTCQCPTYAAAYPCECAPNSCACPTYAAGYPEQCGAAYRWVKGKKLNSFYHAEPSYWRCSGVVGKECKAGQASESCYEEEGSRGEIQYQVSNSTDFLCSGSPDITNLYSCAGGRNGYYYFVDDNQNRFVSENDCEKYYDYGAYNQNYTCKRIDVDYSCPASENWKYLSSGAPSDPTAACMANSSGEEDFYLYYCDYSSPAIGLSYTNGEDEKVYQSKSIRCYADYLPYTMYQLDCKPW